MSMAASLRFVSPVNSLARASIPVRSFWSGRANRFKAVRFSSVSMPLGALARYHSRPAASCASVTPPEANRALFSSVSITARDVTGAGVSVVAPPASDGGVELGAARVRLPIVLCRSERVG